jgi:hypothetical protein
VHGRAHRLHLRLHETLPRTRQAVQLERSAQLLLGEDLVDDEGL